MPDRYGETPDPVVDFDSRRRNRDTAAKAEAARKQRERLAETRAVHAPLDHHQQTAARQHRAAATTAADTRRNQLRIANCGLCNDDGYRGATVCDHIDRTDTNRRGIAACRAALEAVRSAAVRHLNQETK